MSSTGKIVLNYGDSLIRESDLKLLRQNDWLNDLLIGFYFEYLEEKTGGTRMKFYHPDVAQFIKMCSNSDVSSGLNLTGGGDGESLTEYLFFPVNDCQNPESQSGGSHWSLLVYSRAEKMFAHFDSSGANSNTPEALKLFRVVGKIVDKESKFVQMECSCQNNCVDCGVHVLSTAKLISDYLNDVNNKSVTLRAFKKEQTSSPSDALKMRKFLDDLIVKLGDDEAKKNTC